MTTIARPPLAYNCLNASAGRVCESAGGTVVTEVVYAKSLKKVKKRKKGAGQKHNKQYLWNSDQQGCAYCTLRVMGGCTTHPRGAR